MSRFRFSVLALAVIVVAIVTIGACARQASATTRTHTTSGRLVSRAAAPAYVSARVGSAADSEWAVASHVNW